jgi:hypothetical protein
VYPATAIRTTCAAAVMLLMCGCSADLGRAPSRAWPIMLGAIEEVVGAERERRLTEFRLRWGLGGMRRGEWAELAREWNVCDRIEMTKDCRMPASRALPRSRGPERSHYQRAGGFRAEDLKPNQTLGIT